MIHLHYQLQVVQYLSKNDKIQTRSKARVIHLSASENCREITVDYIGLGRSRRQEGESRIGGGQSTAEAEEINDQRQDFWPRTILLITQ